VRLRLGTRGSALALAQSGAVARALEGLGAEVELVRIETAGDADQIRPFAQIGEPGVFVRALEHALCEERIDLAVHSYKDLPSSSPAELLVAAAPERADPRDRLLVRADAFDPAGGALPLAPGARVGTSSARRAALLLDLRPDLATGLLRGNVDTRLAKVERGEFDAILLAAAGLDRLAAGGGARPSPSLRALDLDPACFVPAPAQGALALQVRAADGAACALVARLDHAPTRRAVRAERHLLALVEAGCQAPFGAFARPALAGGGLELFAVLERDGRLLRARAAGDEPETLARAAFEALRAEGSP
jgi:hydroxymethylbilane synthase